MRTLANLAGHPANDPAAAVAHGREALQIAQRIADAAPDVTAELDLAAASVALARALSRASEDGEAERVLQAGEVRLAGCAAAHPERRQLRGRLASLRNGLGDVVQRRHGDDQALPIWVTASEEYKDLATRFPGAPELRKGLARTLMNCSLVQMRAGDLARARELGGEAVREIEAATGLSPRKSALRNLHARCLGMLCVASVQMGEHRDAARHAGDLRAVPGVPTESLLGAASALAQCANLVEADEALADGERQALFADYARSASEALPAVLSAEPGRASVLRLPDFDGIRGYAPFRELSRPPCDVRGQVAGRDSSAAA